MIEPKWYAASAVFLIEGIAGAAYLILNGRGLDSCKTATLFEVCTVIVCSLQAAFMLLQHVGVCNTYGKYTIGSFDNAAGFVSCICLGMPMGLRLVRNMPRPHMTIFAACKLICLAAILMSCSRTGYICLIASALFYFCGRKTFFRILPFVFPLLAIFLSITLKTGSSLGRWFIIRRTAELIMQRPITGWGYGGFEAHYMDVQADYFEKYPNSHYAILADNIHHPLNEFMAFAVDFGLPALVLLFTLICFTIIYCSRNPSQTVNIGFIVFLNIIILSFFSYPFLYPFTWLMLAFSLICIYNRQIKRFKPLRPHYIISIIFLTVSLYALSCRCIENMQFRRIQDKAIYGNAIKILPEYERLYKKLRSDYRFLYNYSAVLYKADRYNKALHTADECGKYLADYDLCLLKGDINLMLKDYKKAIHSYRHAHYMCPNRFEPLYQMALAYRQFGNRNDAANIAMDILQKKEKIPSEDIKSIKNEMRYFLDVTE